MLFAVGAFGLEDNPSTLPFVGSCHNSQVDATASPSKNFNIYKKLYKNLINRFLILENIIKCKNPLKVFSLITTVKKNKKYLKYPHIII